MKKIITITLALILMASMLSACALSESWENKKMPESIKKLNEENFGWIPELTGKYSKKELLFDQMNWDEFEINNDEITFMSVNGSDLNYDLIRKHSDDVSVDIDKVFKQKRMTFAELENCNGLLSNTIPNDKDISLYDYPQTFESGHVSDIRVNKFASGGAEWDLSIYYPCREHNVKASDAIKNDGFYLIPISYDVKTLNRRSNYVFEAYSGNFYHLICPYMEPIENNMAGEYIDALANKLGRPTGLITLKKADVFNYHIWYMYWERDGYTICQKIEEKNFDGTWKTSFYPPIYLHGSAWEFIKGEMVPDSGYTNYENITL